MIKNIKNDSLTWYHIINPGDNDFLFLTNNFDFHPLDIEDCRSKTQRPKIDIYEDYYFLILHFPLQSSTNKNLITKEIKIFWSEKYVITICHAKGVIDELFNKTKENSELQVNLFKSSSDSLLYKILELLLIDALTLFNSVGEEVELINKQLFNKRAEKTIEKISITRKNIIFLDTIFKPQLRLFKKLESGVIKGYADDMEEYWGNILDYYQKLWDMVEDYKEIIEGLSKTFDSLQTNKINEIMKILTIFSSIMLPLTFVTGLYGMNIVLPFQSHQNSFLIVCGMLAAVIISLLVFFKKRKWL